MSSLDRLVDLVKKTGDRLVIYDPTHGRDIVLLNLDAYEDLTIGRRHAHAMSEEQLLDQINRDISVWRSNRDMHEYEQLSGVLEEELSEHPPADPFEEDFFHASDWHRAGNVIDETYGSWMNEIDEEMDEEMDVEEIERLKRRMTEQKNRGMAGNERASLLQEVSLDSIRPVPLRGEQQEEIRAEGESLPGQDPVFYEEPV